MARKGKLGQKSKRDTIERPVRFKRYGHLFLIVCEDENTEPQYFKQFVNLFPKETLYLKTVGTGLDPKGVVESAIKERDALALSSEKEVDYVWVVFDKDDADLNEARIERFNAAFNIAKEQKIAVAYSNEVFELWLLLHLKDVDSTVPLSRKQIYKDLEAQIKRQQEHAHFTYVHGNAEVIKIIRKIGDESSAIERAKTLLLAHAHTAPINANPSTRMHLLVQEIRNWVAFYTFEPER
jgi:hypothetical protein